MNGVACETYDLLAGWKLKLTKWQILYGNNWIVVLKCNYVYHRSIWIDFTIDVLTLNYIFSIKFMFLKKIGMFIIFLIVHFDIFLNYFLYNIYDINLVFILYVYITLFLLSNIKLLAMPNKHILLDIWEYIFLWSLKFTLCRQI